MKIYRIKFLLTGMMLLTMVFAYGQKTTIKGKVVDVEGSELIGASVVVKGTGTPIGTITDVKGNFVLEIPSGTNQLVVSYIGYLSQDVILDGKTEIKVILQPSVHSLDAVVVTALGIKKEKKALGYAFTEVNGEEMSTNRDVNFINSMSNKIAGVNISQTAGGAGTSSRIIIRGIKSLSTESQPLIVVDGIPLDNSSDGATWLGGLDYGNNLGSIAPDDIETMSVLKGPNAAALYGSRGATGVILITTKKGSVRDQVKVTLNSNFMVDKAYIVGKYQNEYGAGFGGSIQRSTISPDHYEELTPENQAKVEIVTDSVTGLPNYYAYYNYGTGSWGPKLDGSMEVLNWNDEFVKLVPQPNNVKDYFNTGYTFTNSIGLEKGTEKFNWRLSITDLRNKGMKPNSEYNRDNLNYTMTSKLNSFVSVNFKASYIKEAAFNREGQGDSRTGARTFIWMPRSIDMNTLRDDYKDKNGYEKNWYKDSDWHTNPYWESYENYNNDTKDQFGGYIKLDFNFTSWLNGFIRSSLDTYTSRRYLRVANYALRAYGEGSYTDRWLQYKSINHDFFLTAKKDFGEDWNTSVSWGGNYYNYMTDYQSTTISGLAVPNFFSINNAKNPDETSAGSTLRKKVIQSTYYSGQVSYKNWLFFETTGRWDWSSSLPVENLPYFYPSFNTSWVFTDALGMKSDILSFGKIRLSYAEVGNDTDPHQLSMAFINQKYGDIPATYLYNTITKPGLEPERTSSYEVGSDLRFFNNRLGVDFTYYNETTRNQIVFAEISKGSGVDKILTNGGEIQNKGIELQFNATPVETSNFKWNLAFNYAQNQNMVVSLADGLSQLTITNESQVDIVAVPGRPYGEIIGTRIKRYYKTDGNGTILDDPNNGKPLVDASGLYVYDERGVIGNVTPDWIGGFTNNLKYKNVSLAFSIGIQIGGDIFSKTNKYGLDNGQFEETLEGRESWYAATTDERNLGRKGLYNTDGTPMLDVDGKQLFDATSEAVGYVSDGVLADGTINKRGMDPQVFWHQRKWGGIAELDVYDASYIKLRDITINYDFPSYWFENKLIKSASLSFVANNVWLIYSGVPNIDPESSFTSNNNGLGQEYAAMPSARSFGFNLKVIF